MDRFLNGLLYYLVLFGTFTLPPYVIANLLLISFNFWSIEDILLFIISVRLSRWFRRSAKSNIVLIFFYLFVVLRYLGSISSEQFISLKSVDSLLSECFIHFKRRFSDQIPFKFKRIQLCFDRFI